MRYLLSDVRSLLNRHVASRSCNFTMQAQAGEKGKLDVLRVVLAAGLRSFAFGFLGGDFYHLLALTFF